MRVAGHLKDMPFCFKIFLIGFGKGHAKMPAAFAASIFAAASGAEADEVHGGSRWCKGKVQAFKFSKVVR